MTDCGAADGLPAGLTRQPWHLVGSGPIRGARLAPADFEDTGDVSERQPKQLGSGARRITGPSVDLDVTWHDSEVPGRHSASLADLVSAQHAPYEGGGRFIRAVPVPKRQVGGDGQRIIEGLEEAVAVARGEATGARVRHVRVDKRQLDELLRIEDFILRSGFGDENARKVEADDIGFKLIKQGWATMQGSWITTTSSGTTAVNVPTAQPQPVPWLKQVTAEARDRMAAAAMTWHREHSHLPRHELAGEKRMRELVEAMLEAASG